jgi:hypothetical protein
METKVLTQEEINKLKLFQETQTDLINKFGVLEYQFQILTQQKQDLIQELLKQKQLEDQLGKELQQKYGNGSINLEKGEFISLV